MIAAEFTVTGVVPVELRISVFVVVAFTAILPKLRLVALIDIIGFATVPVPLSDTTDVVPLLELLLIESCPVAAPVAVGLNCTCSVSVCAGFKVVGKVTPTMINPVPVIPAALTVTADVPVELKVSVCVVAVFTVTLPKLRLAALTPRIGFAAATPVPLSDTTDVIPLLELLLIESCPVAAPVAVGLNCTDSVNVWPGFSVAGRLPPTMVNPAPVIAAALTVTADVPVELKVNVFVVAVFTVTLPKLRLIALTPRIGFAAATPVPLSVTTEVAPLLELLLIVS